MEEDQLLITNIHGFGPIDSPIHTSKWNFFLSLLTAKERSSVTKFLFIDDQKRALLSILLQKYVVRTWFNISNNVPFSLLRTKEGKPYHKLHHNTTNNNAFGSLYRNFNATHHGPYVGIVASESRLVGVDIVDSGTRMNGVHAASQYITIFRDQLHPNECQFIINQPSETCRYTVFFIIWALKESFIKAIGIGLGFPLHQIEFNITFTDTPEQFHTTQIEQNTRNIEEMNVEKAHTHSFSLCANTNKLTGTATAIIQGHQRPDWKFSFFNLDDRYIIAIAYGPFFDALPSYQIDAWGSLLPNPNPKFALKIPNVIVGNDVIYDSTDDSFERSNDDVSVMDRAASCFNCICSCAARYLCCRKVKSSTGNSGTGNSSSSSSSNNSGRAHVYGSIPTVDPDDSSADTSHFEHIHSNTSTDITDMSSANRLTSGPVANNSEVITYKDILKEINIENLLCLEDLIRYQELFPTSTV